MLFLRTSVLIKEEKPFPPQKILVCLTKTDKIINHNKTALFVKTLSEWWILHPFTGSENVLALQSTLKAVIFGRF